MQKGGPTLSDPDYSAFVWKRFRRVMGWMAVVALLAIVAVLLFLRWSGVPMPPSLFLGVIGGVGGTVMLGGALMSLVFLSAGSGHDDDVVNLLEEE